MIATFFGILWILNLRLLGSALEYNLSPCTGLNVCPDGKAKAVGRMLQNRGFLFVPRDSL